MFIADDVEAIRFLWRTFLEEDHDVEVVGEAADGSAAIEGVKALKPDVLVLDLSMPGRDGLEVLCEIAETTPETGVVVASGFSSSRVAEVALGLGAAAYFEKGEAPEELRTMVKAACTRPAATDQT